MVQSASLELFDTTAVVSLMTADEAQQCVNAINGHMNSARALLLDLYERRGWEALGYSSWRECASEEFEHSYQYLYRQLEAAQIEQRISPMGEIGQIPERQIRPLSQITPIEQPPAWDRAHEIAEEQGEKFTARHVEQAVKEWIDPKHQENGYTPYDELLQTDVPEPQEDWIPDEHEVFVDPVAEHATEIIEAPRVSRFNEGMRSSATPEWYTPQNIINKVIEFFGHIDLDPCSNSNDTSIAAVPALKHYSVADDGLSQPWHGRVYMNPPYGKVIRFWTGRLVQAWEAGEIYGALALVPARTDTGWFQPLFDYPICFIRGRLQFIGAIDDPESPANFPSAIVYLGNDIDLFIDVFGPLGRIVRPVE